MGNHRGVEVGTVLVVGGEAGARHIPAGGAAFTVIGGGKEAASWGLVVSYIAKVSGVVVPDRVRAAGKAGAGACGGAVAISGSVRDGAVIHAYAAGTGRSRGGCRIYGCKRHDFPASVVERVVLARGAGVARSAIGRLSEGSLHGRVKPYTHIMGGGWGDFYALQAIAIGGSTYGSRSYGKGIGGGRSYIPSEVAIYIAVLVIGVQGSEGGRLGRGPRSPDHGVSSWVENAHLGRGS